MKERPSKEQVDARVNELLRVMLDGAQKWDYVEYIRQREAEVGTPWHVAEGEEPLGYSQLRRYVQKAQRMIAEAGQGDRTKLLCEHIAKRDNLYAKAVSQGDIRAALAVLADQARLLDLYPARRTEHTGANGEALYPSLSAMVVAIIKQEAQANGVNDNGMHVAVLEAPGHDPGNASGDATTFDRSEEVPRQPCLLHDELLQNTCVE